MAKQPKKPPITLAGNLPAAAAFNGLPAIEPDLVDRPATLRYAVVMYDVQKRTIDTDTDETTPVVRIRRFEPVDGDDAADVEKMLDRVSEARLGTLPYPTGDGEETGGETGEG